MTGSGISEFPGRGGRSPLDFLAPVIGRDVDRWIGRALADSDPGLPDEDVHAGALVEIIRGAEAAHDIAGAVDAVRRRGLAAPYFDLAMTARTAIDLASARLARTGWSLEIDDRTCCSKGGIGNPALAVLAWIHALLAATGRTPTESGLLSMRTISGMGSCHVRLLAVPQTPFSEPDLRALETLCASLGWDLNHRPGRIDLILPVET